MDLREAGFTDRRQVIVTIIGFFVLGALVYGLTLPHAFVNLNDPELIYANPIVQHISWATIKDAFTHFDPELYIPLTFLSYQLDWWIGNGSAFVFHLDNLLLHIVNSLLVVWMFGMLSKNRWIGILCGLVFLVHPIGTEAVLWASARKDLLSTFFGRSTFIAYLYYLRSGKKPGLWLSIALFVFALSAKVKVILLPLTLLLVDWKEGRPWSRELIIEKIPYFVLSIVFGIIGLFAKQDVIASSSLTTKIFLAVNSMAFYLQHFFIPKDFSVYYPYLGVPSLLSPDFLVPLLIVLLFFAVAIVSLRWTKDIFFGCMIYAVGIVASFSNLAKGTDLFFGSDRYAYTALVGITYAVAMGVWLLIRRLPEQRLRPAFRWAAASCCAVVIGLAFLAYKQSKVWANGMTLFDHAIAERPEFYRPYYDAGVAYDMQGDAADALASYKHALDLNPGFPLTYINIGRVEYQQGMRTDARAAFTKALQFDPHFAMAHFNLAVMDSEDRLYADAQKEYQAAIAADPAFLDARLNLAAMEIDHGDTQTAISDLQHALAMDPSNPKSLALAQLFVQRGIPNAML